LAKKPNNTQRDTEDDADSLLVSMQEKHDALTDLLESASAMLSDLTEIQSKATVSHDALTETANEISELQTAAQEDGASTKSLADKAATLDSSISSAHGSMTEIIEETEALKQQVESLLPGATSTGLAVAFMKRMEGYQFSRRLWTALTIISIVALACCGWNSKLSQLAMNPDSTWDVLFRGLVWRLPFVLPMVWLAIYAGRHQMLNTRLEEDYAYKEALSRSFEGYKRQMQDLGEDVADSPLSALCTNTLNAMSQSPGRLYDKKHVDFTPVNALLDSMDKEKLDAILKLAELPEGKIAEMLKKVE
jgi:uncharacterized phage infection (PIP) family protein YhgE